MAKMREEKHKSKVRKNEFTKNLIYSSNLVGSEVSLVYALAQKIASATDGLDSTEYQNVLTEVVKGSGNGDLITRLSQISQSSKLDAQSLMKALMELPGREHGDFTTLVRGRLQAIDAERKKKRPDLSFLRGDPTQNVIVIVELKSLTFPGKV